MILFSIYLIICPRLHDSQTRRISDYNATWIHSEFDMILFGVAPCIHHLDELMQLFRRFSKGFDSSYLAPGNALLPADAIYGHNCVCRRILPFSDVEIEPIPIEKAATKRACLVDHCVYELVIASKQLKGKYPIRLNHSSSPKFLSADMVLTLVLF